MIVSESGSAPDAGQVVTSFKDFASMAPPEADVSGFLAEKLGAEKAGALFDEFGSGFASSDYTVWVLNEALSSPGDDE